VGIKPTTVWLQIKLAEVLVHVTPFLFCGERRIRTPESLSALHAFQACSLNHSDIPPVEPDIGFEPMTYLRFRFTKPALSTSKRIWQIWQACNWSCPVLVAYALSRMWIKNYLQSVESGQTHAVSVLHTVSHSKFLFVQVSFEPLEQEPNANARVKVRIKLFISYFIVCCAYRIRTCVEGLPWQINSLLPSATRSKHNFLLAKRDSNPKLPPYCLLLRISSGSVLQYTIANREFRTSQF